MPASTKPIHYICFTCGTQFSSTQEEPCCCPICEDERQYVAKGGQRWTTHNQLLREGYHNVVKEEEPCVLGIGVEPSFAIGQRALLIQTGEGNILWDCVTVLDERARARLHELGGIAAIAISHPHFYTRMADWAEEFGAEVYVHADDRQWVMQPSERIVYWTGDRRPLLGGATLLRLGGHFPGSAVLHWAPGADRRGILCTGTLCICFSCCIPGALGMPWCAEGVAPGAGDTIQAVPRAGWVSFMYSYPNLLPLPAEEVERIRKAVEGWPEGFERLYGGWFGRAVHADAKAAVLQSADRYAGLLRGTLKRHWNS